MKSKVLRFEPGHIKMANNKPIVLIAGPCVIENEQKTLHIAYRLKNIAKQFGMPFIFKASYDKANRSSIDSFRGPGLKDGLNVLREVKEKYGLTILTDVHCCEDVKEVAKVADIIQIPAFLCRQTDLIVECALTGLPINIKKGQFLAPDDVMNIISKMESSGNKKIIITERGTSFGYHNLVVDMRSLPIIKNTGYPVVFDATHSVQLPGGLGKSSGGQKEFIKPLGSAAAAVGIAGIFIEVHTNPSKALSDGANSLSIVELSDVLYTVGKIDNLVKKEMEE